MPEILCLQLCRFQYVLNDGNYRREKIVKKINIPEWLDIGNYLTKPPSSSSKTNLKDAQTTKERSGVFYYCSYDRFQPKAITHPCLKMTMYLPKN